MTDGKSGEQKTQRERLEEHLVEERDEAHSMHKKAADKAGEGYAYGRYHAIVDVLVWLSQNWEDEQG